MSGRLEEAVKERERKERGESTVKKELEAVGERRREAEAALARAEGEASHMAGTIRFQILFESAPPTRRIQS